MAKLSYPELLELGRWNTPTIYNGWEAVSKRNRLECVMSREALTDYMPSMGAMVGYAVTVEYTCKDAAVKSANPDCYKDMFKYIASIPGPKILVAKDLDAPDSVGSIFGEVTGNVYKALGCNGCITDGFVRDVDEAAGSGIKFLAKRLGVSHTYSCPVRFGAELDICGAHIAPGMLIHGDKYGFIAIPEEDQENLLKGVRFMDSLECKHTIPVGRGTFGLTEKEVLDQLCSAWDAFGVEADAFAKEHRSK